MEPVAFRLCDTVSPNNKTASPKPVNVSHSKFATIMWLQQPHTECHSDVL